MFNPRRSSVKSVEVEVNPNVANNVEESLVDATPVYDDDWDFKRAVRLDAIERDSVRRRFRDIQDSYRVTRQNILGTVADAMELEDELANEISESVAQVANDAVIVTLPLAEAKVVSLLTVLKKTCKEAVSAKM